MADIVGMVDIALYPPPHLSILVLRRSVVPIEPLLLSLKRSAFVLDHQ